MIYNKMESFKSISVLFYLVYFLFGGGYLDLGICCTLSKRFFSLCFFFRIDLLSLALFMHGSHSVGPTYLNKFKMLG